jgi:putative oxidoreductase
MAGLLEVLSPYSPVLLLVLRIFLGWRMATSGYPKLRGGRVQSEKWMKSMGIPPIAADLVTILEFFGGIFLVVGLLTPLVALFFVIEFASIVWMKRTKLHAKFSTREEGKPMYEVEVFIIALALVFLVFGAGAYSLDHLLGL